MHVDRFELVRQPPGGLESLSSRPIGKWSPWLPADGRRSLRSRPSLLQQPSSTDILSIGKRRNTIEYMAIGIRSQPHFVRGEHAINTGKTLG